MFDRFTDRAKRVMSLSYQEARRLQHPYIAPEHMLLGIVLDGTGVAVNVLRNSKVDLEAIRRQLEALVPRGPSPMSNTQLPFTPEGKRVLELAMTEANQFAHNYIGSEHLLLGLANLQEGNVASVLAALGVRLDDVRRELRAIDGEAETSGE